MEILEKLADRKLCLELCRRQEYIRERTRETKASKKIEKSSSTYRVEAP